MPCIATAQVVGHLYGPPELKSNDKGKYCRVRLWTNDKIKGQDEKKFTSWGGLVSGPQAEWICRDGKKGTMVFISGTIRLDTFKKQDGTESHSIEFTRVNECRSLEGREDKEAAVPQPPARPSAPVAAAASSEEPPF